MSYGFAAAALLVAGFGLLGWAVQVLGWRRWLDLDEAAPEPGLPALVLSGPFRLVRHPQSLGLLCLLGAAALAWRRPGMWLATLAVGALVLALARRDEARLAARFGEAFRRYRDAVPFIVPRPR